MATSAITQEPEKGQRVTGPLVLRVQVEELPQQLGPFEHQLAKGGVIELLRGSTVVAELRAPAPPPPLPDFMGRMKAIWGDKVLPSGTMTRIIREDRDARG